VNQDQDSKTPNFARLNEIVVIRLFEVMDVLTEEEERSKRKDIK